MCYSVMVKQDLTYLSKLFGAKVKQEEFDGLSKPSLLDSKVPKYTPRLYPGYFGPVLFTEDKEPQLAPMRYRLRPAGSSEEVPSKYNMFNARLDALEVRPSWQRLVGRKHGIVVLERFYEWVEDKNTGRKKVISFFPQKSSEIYVPILWDEWTDGQTKLKSFALITDEPPPEVLSAGHDRCPISLNLEGSHLWLSCQRPFDALKHRSVEVFGHEASVP